MRCHSLTLHWSHLKVFFRAHEAHIPWLTARPQFNPVLKQPREMGALYTVATHQITKDSSILDTLQRNKLPGKLLAQQNVQKKGIHF